VLFPHPDTVEPMLRFFQTGDWHLGQPYRQFDADRANALRAARLDAVGRVLAEAEAAGVAFVAVTGDQFDGPHPDPDLVRELLDRVGSCRLPVHMIPGNHDPGEPGSVYDREGFRNGPANLHFHDKAGPVPLPDLGATLFPCPCLARFGDDPMAWIPPRGAGEGLRIALAHGSLPGFADPGGRNYAIAADAPGRLGLDYVALGDWHTPTPDPSARPGERMYYAGAPEVGGWDETGAGFALEVGLEAGAAPVVARRRVGRHEWSERAPQLYSPEDVARFLGELDELDPRDRIVRVVPTGALPVASRVALAEAIEGRAPRFADLALDLAGLRLVADSDAAWPADPILREVARRLGELAADPTGKLPAAFPDTVPAPDAEAIVQALRRFRGLLH